MTDREPVRSANYFNDQTKCAAVPVSWNGFGGRSENKTFTISGKQATRVFKVTDKTVTTKGAGAGKFTDIADNQEVSGAYWKNADGSLEAKLIKLGPTEKNNATPAANSSPSTSPSS